MVFNKITDYCIKVKNSYILKIIFKKLNTSDYNKN